MTLLLVGSLGVVVVAAPVEAFSFTQSGYPTFPPIVTPSPANYTSGTLTGSFGGSDLNGDGKITCFNSSTSCELTGFDVRLDAALRPVGTPLSLPISWYDRDFRDPFDPNKISLSYTLADPSSLNFSFLNPGVSSVSAGGNSGSFQSNLMLAPSSVPNRPINTSVSNSPLIVSGDSTPIPEPTTLSGLVLAGVAGAWWKRRSLRQINAS
jgi:hypothetical protein